MLLEFSVGNYLSFKERVTLSLLAADAESDLPQSTLSAPDGTKLLRAAAIYGANASGKSNLIKALSFMRFFVLNSSKDAQAGDPIPVSRFKLSTETEQRPCEFEIVFFQDGVRFRYGFAANEKHVQEEWLFRAQGNEEHELFTREQADYSSIRVAPEFSSPRELGGVLPMGRARGCVRVGSG